MLNVLEHGVIPDGETLNTKALQTVIDRCGSAGGGTLVFPPGRYLTGGLTLRSRITLHLEAGAVLLGSGDLAHYRHWLPSPEPFIEGTEGVRALLFACDAESIRICGAGTIDGQGAQFNRYSQVRAGRPRNLWFARCRDVVVEGVFLRNAGFWMQHYARCTRLRLSRLTIWNHGSCNNDGIDVDGCRDVLIESCQVDSADDAICLKSGCGAATENVVVTACATRSHCNHFKTGTESNGDFRNIRVSGLSMTPSEERSSHPFTEGADWRGACGIALASVDGGALEDIVVEDVSMDGVRVPFFIRLGDRGRPVPGASRQPVARARHLLLRNIRARQASAQGCHISGLPDAPLRSVAIEDCDLEFAGGGDAALLHREVPLQREGYPSMEMLGSLPSYGIFGRDVEDLALRNLRFRLAGPDPRPAVAWHRCREVRVCDVVCS